MCTLNFFIFFNVKHSSKVLCLVRMAAFTKWNHLLHGAMSYLGCVN